MAKYSVDPGLDSLDDSLMGADDVSELLGSLKHRGEKVGSSIGTFTKALMHILIIASCIKHLGGF